METFSYISDFLQILFKHKYTILAVFVLVAGTVIAGTLLMSPTYEVTSTLLLKFGREYIYRPEIGDKAQQSVLDRDLEPLMNSEIQILTSSDLTKKVVTSLGIDQLYPDIAKNARNTNSAIDAATHAFQNNLSVKSMAQASTLRIAFHHSNPRLAAVAVNYLIEMYKEKHLQAFNDPRTTTFLNTKVHDFQEGLSTAQKNLENFKLKYSAFDLTEQRSLLLKQRADLDETYKTTLSEIHEVEQTIDSLSQQTVSLSASLPQLNTSRDAGGIDETNNKLIDLRVKEQELSTKYTDTNPGLVDIRNQIAILEKELDEQRNRLHQDTRGQFTQEMEKQLIPYRAQLRSLGAKKTVLQGQLSQIDQRLATVSRNEGQLRGLELARDTNEQSYQNYQRKLQDALVSQDMDRQKLSNISIIQAATPPAAPIKPNRTLNIMAGLTVGLLTGIALAFLLEWMRKGVNSVRSARERIGVTQVFTIPYRR